MNSKDTYQSGLRRDQIDAYSNTSATNQRETEGKLHDAFDQDALDGWQESGLSTAAMKRLDKRYGFAPKGILTGGAAILTGVTLATVWYFSTQTPSSNRIASAEKVQLRVEQTDAVITPAIDSLTELPVTRQIVIASVRNSQQEINALPEKTTEQGQEEIPAVVLEPITLQPEVVPQKIASQKNAKEIYLHDLKLIDYRLYRTKPSVHVEQIVLTGTPADQEKIEGSETETTIAQIDIPYYDYLEKTMAFVNKGKWKQSLQRLQLILVSYPDDQNAHFYAGLCCYNLQQFEMAKQHFASCLQLTYNNFNEEASWYLAQTLVANGEKNSAREMLTAIRDQNGYYAKQAERLLKGLK